MSELKHKGMKAPRPAAGPALDQSSPPKNKPGMKHNEPSYPKEEGAQSKAPDHKKKGLPSADAPAGVAGVNGGSNINVNEHYNNPLKKG